jgi:hypothetical protein
LLALFVLVVRFALYFQISSRLGKYSKKYSINSKRIIFPDIRSLHALRSTCSENSISNRHIITFYIRYISAIQKEETDEQPEHPAVTARRVVRDGARRISYDRAV